MSRGQQLLDLDIEGRRCSATVGARLPKPATKEVSRLLWAHPTVVLWPTELDPSGSYCEASTLYTSHMVGGFGDAG